MAPLRRHLVGGRVLVAAIGHRVIGNLALLPVGLDALMLALRCHAKAESSRLDPAAANGGTLTFG